MKAIFYDGANFPVEAVNEEQLATCVYDTATIHDPRQQHEAAYLGAFNVAPCAALAVIAEDTAQPSGMLHIFSKEQYYDLGEAAVRAHARQRAEAFLSQFPSGVGYAAAAFGGLAFATQTYTPPTTEEMKAAQEIKLKIAACYKNYYSLAEEMHEGLAQTEEAKTLMERMTDELIALGNDPAYKRVLEARNVLCSYWMNDEVRKVVEEKPRFDLEAVHQGAGPYDGVIDLQNRQIVIGYGIEHEQTLNGALPSLRQHFSQRADMFSGSAALASRSILPSIYGSSESPARALLQLVA